MKSGCPYVEARWGVAYIGLPRARCGTLLYSLFCEAIKVFMMGLLRQIFRDVGDKELIREAASLSFYLYLPPDQSAACTAATI